MKIDIQYVNDANGYLKAVQLPFSEWEKLLNKMKQYEEELQLKSSLQDAFAEIKLMKKGKLKKKTLSEFLNDV